MLIVSLGDAKRVELDLIGSKAMNLSKAKEIIENIPDGFVVTALALQQFLKENQLDVADGNVQQNIMDSTISESLQSQILEQFNSLRQDNGFAVAVRSSSPLEDIEGASFAGQYETVLNVRDETALMEAIKKCWASYFSGYVQDYAAKNNVSLDEVKMGVFIQVMIEADVSGVIFSSNPVTHNKQEILINASYGLGETVVDGTVTPDMFIIHKETGHITEELGYKDVQLIPTSEGNKLVGVSVEMQDQFCIDKEMIAELADLTKRIEAFYGFPVDIEFAIANGKIFILQSRPITTLKGE